MAELTSKLALVGILGAPVALLSGFTASYMPFSAWNLIVPVLFVLVGLPVNQTLFVSVMLDIFNCLTVTWIYTSHRKVDYRYGTLFGIYVALVAIILSLSLRETLSRYIRENPDALTNAVTYVPLVIGTQFLIRILIVWRRHRLAVKAMNEEKARKLNGANTDATSDAATDKSAAESQVDVAVNVGSINTMADLAKASADEAGHEHGRPSGHSHGHGHHPHLILPSFHDELKQPLIDKPEDSDDETGGVMSEEPLFPVSVMVVSLWGTGLFGPPIQPMQELSRWQNWLLWLERQYAPEERIIRLRKANRVRRTIITLIVMGIMGAAAGTLGSGGGMFFVNVIMNAWGAKVRMALGTGSYMMFFVMFFVSLTFINRDDMDDINNLYHVLLTVPFGILGAALGSRVAVRVNETVLMIVIMLISYLTFTLAQIYQSVLDRRGSTP